MGICNYHFIVLSLLERLINKANKKKRLPRGEQEEQSGARGVGVIAPVAAWAGGNTIEEGLSCLKLEFPEADTS